MDTRPVELFRAGSTATRSGPVVHRFTNVLEAAYELPIPIATILEQCERGPEVVKTPYGCRYVHRTCTL